MAVASEPSFGDRLDPDWGDRGTGAGPGTQVVSADPANQYEGMMWFRSDTLQLCVRIGAVVRRSAAFT